MADRKIYDAWAKRVLGIDTGLAAGLARSAERGRAAKAVNVRGIAYPKLLLRWRAAQSNLAASLNDIAKDMLGRREVVEDPRFAKVKQAVALLPTLVPTFGDELEDLIDAGINEGQGSEASTIAGKAVVVIDAYRQKIAGASRLTELEKFVKADLGKALRLGGELDAALVELRAQLATAA